MSTLASPAIDQIQEANRNPFVQKWNIIPVGGLPPSVQNIAHKLNCLGSNFYFIKVGLRKHRLSNNFHRQFCDTFLCWHLKQVNEIPRDHFKTTIGAIGMPMWWSLPFTTKEEKLMRDLGYDDAFIAWMHRAHEQNSRTLIAMETIDNALKVGKKITFEYENNQFFKHLFPDILPDSSCQWTAKTMTHRQDNSKPNAGQGEGTYDFIGVGGALQSRHYFRVISDDLFGKDALKSELVAQDTWEWFQLLVGAFDSDKDSSSESSDEVVNGNRWSFHDLNYKIREKLPEFKFNTHDAEGGCCDLHPPGQVIFPEEWSFKKLNEFKNRLGEYFYSCQFRNKPISPGGNQFKQEWQRFFVYKTVNVESIRQQYIPKDLTVIDEQFGTQSYKIIPYEQHEQKRHMAVRHQIHNGVQYKDIPTSYMSKMLLLDPNHKGETGRANHALMLMGHYKNPFNIYVLDGKADTCSREDIIQHAFVLAEKWRIREIWVEISMGQTWCKTAFETESKLRKSLGKWFFYKVNEFKDNRSENAKSDRIEDTEPFFRRGQIWFCQNDESDFTRKLLKEYEEYPHCATRDILDILGHGIQNLQHSTMSEEEIREFARLQTASQATQQQGRNSITGY